jgi:hypothetical protein
MCRQRLVGEAGWDGRSRRRQKIGVRLRDSDMTSPCLAESESSDTSVSCTPLTPASLNRLDET